MTIFTETRNFAIGMVAVAIGFGGMMSGKAFYAKWYSIPKMEETFDSDKFSNETFVEYTQLTDEEVDNIMNNQKPMFRYACAYIAYEQGWEKDFTSKVQMVQLFGKRSKKLSAQETEDIDIAIEEIDNTINSWNKNKKREVIRSQNRIFNETVKEFAEEIAKGMTKAFGYITAFRFLDLLWFPMGMWSAYKIGSGRD